MTPNGVKKKMSSKVAKKKVSSKEVKSKLTSIKVKKLNPKKLKSKLSSKQVGDYMNPKVVLNKIKVTSPKKAKVKEEVPRTNCFLCLKTIRWKTEQGRKQADNFFKFYSRYLYLNLEKVLSSHSQACGSSSSAGAGAGGLEFFLKEADVTVPLCKGCSPIAENFCDIFSQHDLIQVQLKACFFKIQNVMGSAKKEEKVERKWGMKRILKMKNSKHVLTSGFMDNLRMATITKGSSHLKKSTPRIVLRNIKEKKEDKKVTPEEESTNNTKKRKRVTTSEEPPPKLDRYDPTPPLPEPLNKIVTPPSSSKKKKSATPTPIKTPEIEVPFKTLPGLKRECLLCKKIFCRNSAWKFHVKSHTTQKSYECPLCKKVFSDLGNLRSHKKLLHRGSFFTTYKDPRLPPEKLESLIGDILQSLEFEMQDNKIKCPSCSKPFSTKEEVEGHLLVKHIKYLVPKLMTLQVQYFLENGAEVFKQGGKNGYSLNKTFTGIVPLHEEIEEGIEQDEENVTLPGEDDEDEEEVESKIIKQEDDEDYKPGHGRKIKKEKYKCRQCGMVKQSLGKLQLHMNSHKKEKIYQCISCPGKFSEVSQLRIHTLKLHRDKLLAQFKPENWTDDKFKGAINKIIKRQVENGGAGIKSNRCLLCHKTYRGRKDAEGHVILTHFDDVTRELVKLQK